MSKLVLPKGLSAVERIEFSYIPEPNSGCWLWLGTLTKSGYGTAAVEGKTVGAHRASYLAFCGPIPEGLFICHRCNNRACVNPDHLYAGTHTDNMADRKRAGLYYEGEDHWTHIKPERLATGEKHWSNLHPDKTCKGERNGSVKITEQELFEIRAAFATGEPGQRIAKRYGLGKTQIYRIRDGRSWRHL